MPHPASLEWLKNAVIYNIYPQSYSDSNGDGIGDLPGIIERLDYIESLGVTCLWLNPIYCSPFQDAGYDITDHYRIAPRYGSKNDLKRLLRECHRRGLRLLLDLVPGHTSNQHPWFQKSAEAPRNAYSDRYIWSRDGFGNDADPDMIRGFGRREGHYKPNFFWFQPALNYGYARPNKPWQLPTSHPSVRQTRSELKSLLQYWLEFGVDGFRVDMAASLVKEDPDNRANQALWRSIRQWMDQAYPGRVLISEWSWPSRAIASGFHVDFMIHFNNDAYNSLFRHEPGRNVFPGNGYSYFAHEGRGDITTFLKTYEQALKDTSGRGYISLPTGNHDLPRLNFHRTTRELKVIHTFIFTMPGVPTLYYGDEIGLRNQTGLASHEGGYIRTAARTPMQWDSSKNAGFSSAHSSRLYLPVDSRKNRPTVARQHSFPDSLLQHVRRLIDIRKRHPALSADGTFQIVYAKPKKHPLVFLREKDGQQILVALNPCHRPVSILLDHPAKPFRSLIRKLATLTEEHGRFRLRMSGASYAVFEIKKSSKSQKNLQSIN